MDVVIKTVGKHRFEYPEIDGVAVLVRPFPLSRLAVSDETGAVDPIATAKRRFVEGFVGIEGITLRGQDGEELLLTDELKGTIFDYPGLTGFPSKLLTFIRDKIDEVTWLQEDVVKNSSASQDNEPAPCPASYADASKVKEDPNHHANEE